MRYIVDITQLVHWPGNLTGIPRVMDELAIRFSRYNPENTIFVSWVKERNEMCEIDFISTRGHRGNGIDYLNTGRSVFAPARVYQIKYIKKAIKKVAVKSRLDKTGIFKKSRNFNYNHELQNYKVYTIQSGDKLFIPWGEWWDQNWLNKVKSYAANGVKIYPMCHDILPMVVPQFSGNSASLAEFVKQIYPIAETVLTQSESTKNDLAEWMGKKELRTPKILSFRLGEDFSISKSKIDDSATAKKYDVQKDNFLICVGTIEPRKNHTLLYYTYKLAVARGIVLPKLLIIGRAGHDTAEIVKFIREDPDMIGQVEICNDVGDDDLNWLYQNCMFTVQPSFYEGWGMPVIESIARGKPAVCSNTSSLKEMPDDCVLRFQPASTDECLRVIQEMMRPATLKQHTEAAKNYQQHSWDDSFKQVIAILGDK